MRYSVLNFSTKAVERAANWVRNDMMPANAVGGEEGDEEKKSTSGIVLAAAAVTKRGAASIVLVVSMLAWTAETTLDVSAVSSEGVRWDPNWVVSSSRTMVSRPFASSACIARRSRAKECDILVKVGVGHY